MLYTIGYEGRELDELVAILAAHGITRLIDIRELPLSRRRGFSKSPLSDYLARAGIEYVHLPAAGNPYRREKTELAREVVLAKYRAHLAGADAVIDEVAAAARERPTALLCFERDPARCHRSILAPRVARRLQTRLVDL